MSQDFPSFDIEILVKLFIFNKEPFSFIFLCHLTYSHFCPPFPIVVMDNEDVNMLHHMETFPSNTIA